MGKTVTVRGDISYNGLTWKEVLPKLPQLAGYVPQSDQHFPSLTVQDTLEFAHSGSAGNEQADQYLHHTETIIGQLGLQACRDTMIGNGLTRGVSGGERRRVTTEEMTLATKCVSFPDEITTGLDSATAFDIVWRQREIAKNQCQTVVMALLQPTPEIFELFDNILLLHDGEVIFHGPREQVLPYFQQLCLMCPVDVDAADFLLDIATKQQQQYEFDRAGV